MIQKSARRVRQLVATFYPFFTPITPTSTMPVTPPPANGSANGAANGAAAPDANRIIAIVTGANR